MTLSPLGVGIVIFADVSTSNEVSDLLVTRRFALTTDLICHPSPNYFFQITHFSVIIILHPHFRFESSPSPWDEPWDDTNPL